MTKRANLAWLVLALMAANAAAQTQTTVVTTSPTAGTVPVFGTTSGGNTSVTNSPITVSGSSVGIGTTTPGNPLSVNGVINAGGSYFNVLTYSLDNSPVNGTKIQTNIPYLSSAEMPTIIIQGYNYGASEPIGLILNWYIYNGSFIQYAVSSFGAYAPTIQLSDENGYVVIFINDQPYFERFTVQAYAHGMSELPSWFNGWTTVDQPVTGSNTVTVPYKNNLSGNIISVAGSTFSGNSSFTGNTTFSGSTTFTGNIGMGAAYSTYTPDGLFGTTALPSRWFTPSGDYGAFGYSDAGNGQFVPRIGFYAAYAGSPGNQVASETSIGLEPISADFTIRGGAGNSEYLRVLNSNGNVGIGTTTPAYTLDVAGQIHSSTGGYVFPDGTTQTTAFIPANCGADFAESVGVAGNRPSYEPGDLLVIDSDHPGSFLKSNQAYSTMVAGVYSTKPGFVGRKEPASDPASKNEVPMAMVGRVPTKVSAENGPIHVGDLLVTSSTMGYAMKGTDRGKMLGAVIGKALGPLDSGTGVIEVLVTLQ
jgi:hypothetical protein